MSTMSKSTPVVPNTDNRLPEQFEAFAEARRNAFLGVKKIKDEGKRVAGTFCTYTPNEILWAAGFSPVGLCGMSNETVPDAEIDLPKNLCPLIKSSYGFAITDKCPFTYFSDILVGETTCDGKKKMYELLGRIKPVHTLQLPQIQDPQRSLKLWTDEMRLLAQRLRDEFGAEFDDDDLRRHIKTANRQRRIMLEFLRLGELRPAVMSGYDLYKTSEGNAFIFDQEERYERIAALVESLRQAYAEGQRIGDENSKRILITGCPMGGVLDKVIKPLEEQGAVVVGYENCFGERENLTLVDESPERDPYEALAEKYLQINCSVMTPNPGRLDTIEDMAQRYQVDGIVEVVLQACHTYAVETKTVKEKAAALGIPYIAVETDYANSDSGQLQTRLAAFVEIL